MMPGAAQDDPEGLEAHLMAALEHILLLQRAHEEASRLSSQAAQRLDQAEGALLELARAALGAEKAGAIYARAAERAGSEHAANLPSATETGAAGAEPNAAPHAAPLTLFAPEEPLAGAPAAAAATPDIGQFDGSADPNPGGRMGMGWHLDLRDGREFTGTAEAPPAPGNSNNQAEYLALLALLDEYVEIGGRGPLLVRGDSQLVISQMRGIWRVRHPALQPLYERARQATRRIPGGVTFEWVPRMFNARADRLASGSPGNAPDAPETLTYAQAPIEDVPPQLAARIAALNASGSVSFKDCLALRVGGKDRCSEMRWAELVAAAGSDCVRACAEAFPGDQRGQATALRWALRGLAVEHAIKKVKADQQVLAQKASSQA